LNLSDDPVDRENTDREGALAPEEAITAPARSSTSTVGTGTFLALGCLAIMILIVIAAVVFHWM
jgi:hypothetical protein